MKTYKKYFKLEASPADIYNALTNKVMLEIWTGDIVEFQEKEDTEFSLWDDAICGRNVKFIKDRQIEQVWYFDEVESSVIIKLHPGKAESTSVEVRQENIPDEAYENIVSGWEDDYFGALAELFN